MTILGPLFYGCDKIGFVLIRDIFLQILYELLERFCPRTEIKIKLRGDSADDDDDDDYMWHESERSQSRTKPPATPSLSMADKPC